MFNLLGLLRTYKTFDKQEEDYRIKTMTLLKNMGLSAFDNDYFTPGHVTGSAFILNRTNTKTLLIRHSALNQWFQPGGHSDGQPNTFSVALRELEEETGVLASRISWANEDIFDIDIHTIPENKKRPEHSHYDIRFLFRFCEKSKLNASITETTDIRWVPLTAVKHYNISSGMLRMLDKCRQF